MIRRILVNALLCVFALSVLLPLLWVIVASVRSSPEILGSPFGLPHTLRWDNYAKAWNEGRHRAVLR